MSNIKFTVFGILFGVLTAKRWTPCSCRCIESELIIHTYVRRAVERKGHCHLPVTQWNVESFSSTWCRTVLSAYFHDAPIQE